MRRWEAPLRSLALFVLLGATPGTPVWAGGGLVCGDLNGDGVSDAVDRARALSYLFFDGTAPTTPALLDVNGDLAIGVGDLRYLSASLADTGPPPYCYVVEERFHGDILVQIGQVLEDTTTYWDPATKYQSAGALFDQLATHMRDLSNAGVPMDSRGIPQVEGLRDGCFAVAKGLADADFQLVANAFANLGSSLHHAYVHRDLAARDPLALDLFLAAHDDLADLAEVTGAIHDPAELPDHYRSLDTLYAMGASALDAIGDTLLAISDLDMQRWLGLDDPVMRGQVDSVWRYVGDRDMDDWMFQARFDAEGLHADIMHKATLAGTVYLGADLFAAGNRMLNAAPILPLVFWWSDEDCEICQNRNCEVDQVTVVNWRTTCKGEQAKRGLLKVAKKIKKPPKLPVGGAPLKSTVIEGVETLQKILLESDSGVRICIKVKWEHCEDVSGWFCTVKRWVPKTSDWIEVPAPNAPLCWPKPSKWGQGGTKQQIEDGIESKVQATCGT